MTTSSRDSELPAGDAESDQYVDRDVDSLPDWWRRHLARFAAHDLRPYRPSRFADGELVPPVVRDLERTYGVTIAFSRRNPQTDAGIDVTVDREAVCRIERTRVPEGYTVYSITAPEFRRLIRAAVEPEDPA